jgi:L-cysteine:1D-myo-inositol 2-amino-2-deoxy-alpha-D-glucopyranoside ligase
MVHFEGEKMSKSLGNLVFVRGLLDQGVDSSDIRLAVLANRFRGSEGTAPTLEGGH